jgi:hypothetical protein
MASIRKPIWPTSSPASSKATRSIASKNCFRELGGGSPSSKGRVTALTFIGVQDEIPQKLPEGWFLSPNPAMSNEKKVPECSGSSKGGRG